MSAKEIYTVFEVARFANVPPSLVLHNIRIGRLGATNIATSGKPIWRISALQLARFIHGKKAKRQEPQQLVRIQRPRWAGRVSF